MGMTIQKEGGIRLNIPEVQRCTINNDKLLTKDPFPTQESDKTILLALEGEITEISVSFLVNTSNTSRYINNTNNENQFLQRLFEFKRDNVEGSSKYTVSYKGLTFSCKIANVNITFENTHVKLIPITIQLYEGTVV